MPHNAILSSKACDSILTYSIISYPRRRSSIKPRRRAAMYHLCQLSCHMCANPTWHRRGRPRSQSKHRALGQRSTCVGVISPDAAEAGLPAAAPACSPGTAVHCCCYQACLVGGQLSCHWQPGPRRTLPPCRQHAELCGGLIEAQVPNAWHCAARSIALSYLHRLPTFMACTPKQQHRIQRCSLTNCRRSTLRRTHVVPQTNCAPGRLEVSRLRHDPPRAGAQGLAQRGGQRRRHVVHVAVHGRVRRVAVLRERGKRRGRALQEGQLGMEAMGVEPRKQLLHMVTR